MFLNFTKILNDLIKIKNDYKDLKYYMRSIDILIVPNYYPKQHIFLYYKIYDIYAKDQYIYFHGNSIFKNTLFISYYFYIFKNYLIYKYLSFYINNVLVLLIQIYSNSGFINSIFLLKKNTYISIILLLKNSFYIINNIKIILNNIKKKHFFLVKKFLEIFPKSIFCKIELSKNILQMIMYFQDVLNIQCMFSYEKILNKNLHKIILLLHFNKTHSTKYLSIFIYGQNYYNIKTLKIIVKTYMPSILNFIVFIIIKNIILKIFIFKKINIFLYKFKTVYIINFIIVEIHKNKLQISINYNKTFFFSLNIFQNNFFIYNKFLNCIITYASFYRFIHINFFSDIQLGYAKGSKYFTSFVNQYKFVKNYYVNQTKISLNIQIIMNSVFLQYCQKLKCSYIQLIFNCEFIQLTTYNLNALYEYIIHKKIKYFFNFIFALNIQNTLYNELCNNCNFYVSLKYNILNYSIYAYLLNIVYENFIVANKFKNYKLKFELIYIKRIKYYSLYNFGIVKYKLKYKQLQIFYIYAKNIGYFNSYQIIKKIEFNMELNTPIFPYIVHFHSMCLQTIHIKYNNHFYEKYNNYSFKCVINFGIKTITYFGVTKFGYQLAIKPYFNTIAAYSFSMNSNL